ncbi:MAG: recombination protein NinG [Pseudomonadota bacterium]
MTLQRTEFQRKPATEPKRRTRKCAAKGCRAPFEPRNMMHKCCGPVCAADYAMSERVKAERASRQEGLRNLKRRADWLKEAQAAFNAFIRARDAKDHCISCGQNHDRFWDAGHYRSVGAQPALRFDENNVHKQCVHCNQHRGGNVVEYRLRLIKKIGPEAVALLEVEHEPAKYSIEDAQRIKAVYKAKLKSLKEKS